jgi:hypothetical protein
MRTLNDPDTSEFPVAIQISQCSIHAKFCFRNSHWLLPSKPSCSIYNDSWQQVQKHNTQVVYNPLLMEMEAVIPHYLHRWVLCPNFIVLHVLTPCDRILCRRYIVQDGNIILWSGKILCKLCVLKSLCI